MNTLEKKQLNLLAHLARIDGKFVKAERDLLKLFMKEKGLINVESNGDKVGNFDLGGIENKIELMFWSLRIINADKVLHPKEIQFCKELSHKLGFKEELVDFYVENELPKFSTFRGKVLDQWNRKNKIS